MTGVAIGLIGIGRMGTPIAKRLLAAGHRLLVHDIDPGRLTALTESGAEAAASPAEIVRASNIIMTCVTNAAALEQVVHGPDGLSGVEGGADLLVDLSSIHPNVTRALAA